MVAAAAAVLACKLFVLSKRVRCEYFSGNFYFQPCIGFCIGRVIGVTLAGVFILNFCCCCCVEGKVRFIFREFSLSSAAAAVFVLHLAR